MSATLKGDKVFLFVQLKAENKGSKGNLRRESRILFVFFSCSHFISYCKIFEIRTCSNTQNQQLHPCLIPISYFCSNHLDKPIQSSFYSFYHVLVCYSPVCRILIPLHKCDDPQELKQVKAVLLKSK